MTIANRVDISEVAIGHFAQSGQLHPDVLKMNPGQIEELIDAVPNTNSELINALEDLLRREGICIIH